MQACQGVPQRDVGPNGRPVFKAVDMPAQTSKAQMSPKYKQNPLQLFESYALAPFYTPLLL